MTDRNRDQTWILPGLLLALAVSLAGCTAPDGGAGNGDDGATYDSFAEAMAAPGPTQEAHPRGYDIHAKLIKPDDPQNVEQRKQDVMLLFWDALKNEPYTDLTVEIQSWMPAMGHGTSGETDPAHEAHGVYAGKINPSMPGAWELRVYVTLPDGIEDEMTFTYTVV